MTIDKLNKFSRDCYHIFQHLYKYFIECMDRYMRGRGQKLQIDFVSTYYIYVIVINAFLYISNLI